MNDDRLTGLLGSLRHQRMDRAADARTRRLLEDAWAGRRTRRRGLATWLRALAPVAASFVLVLALGWTVMSSSGDSPFYGIRVAVEDAAAVLHPDPTDRAQYLLALLDARQTEAARLEAAGNALAAERVRRIERQTLEELKALLPQEQEPEPSPSASAAVIVTPTPTTAPTATPTPVPTTTAGIGGPVATPTRTPPFTARPTATPTPSPEPTVKPTPTPAGTPFLLLVRGTVKNSDGSVNSGACISQSAGGACITTVRADGTYDFTVSARSGQVVTVYAFTKDAGGAITAKAVTSGTVRATTLDMAAMKLQPV